MAYDIDPTKTRQPNSDRLKVLYDALKEDGADVGDSWQFRDWMMADENNRKTVWQAFKDDGADVGEYDEFDTWLYDLGQQPTAATQQPTAQQPAQRKTRYDVAQEQYEQGRQQTNAMPLSQTAMGSVGGYGISPTGIPVRNTQGYPMAHPQPQAPAKPMAPAPRAGQWSGAPMQQTPYAPTEDEGNLQYMPIDQGEDTKARYDAERRAVGGQGGQVQRQREEVDSLLAAEEGKRQRRYNPITRMWEDAEGNPTTAGTFGEMATSSVRERDLQAAQRALGNAQKMIDEANAGNKGFIASAGRGMRDKFFDPSMWDFGITDLTDQAAIYSALQAYDEGGEEALTESQRQLLDAKALELATTAYFGSEVGRGYKAGQVTAEAIPLMFEMAINPAAGIGKGASKAMVRYALKKFGKEAIEKGGKRYIAKQAMKYGTRIGGDVVGASGMAVTTGAARTAADALDRMAGNLHYDTDEQGNITFDGHTDAESWVKAFGKAFASTTIENYSEMLGNYFGPALGLLGKGAGKIGKGLSQTRVADFIRKINAGKTAQFLTELESRAQWHGVMGEYAEEVAGGILNALVVGDQTLDTDKDTGVFNLDNNIDTFLGVALMGGFFSGARTVGYGAERAHNARQFNKANRMGVSAFGDGWADVQAAIESDPEAGAVAVLSDPNATREQREAALRYAQAVVARQGMEQGKAKRDAEGVQTMQEAAAEQSYNTGYEDANTDELRSDINMAYTDARQTLVGLIGEDAVNDIDSDPLAMQAQYDQDMTVDDNTKSAIADYVSAKSAWDGVQQRISDDAADRADQRKVEGEKMAYKGKGDMQGTIRPLTINEDSSERDPETGERKKKTVYLVNGNIAIEPNGNGLSREGTDKTIYVYDPETGDTHELDPFGGAGVLSVGDAVSMEDYLADNEQQSQAEVQQEIDNATGKVNVAPNTPFVTPEGRQGVVKSVEGENVIVQFADGNMEEASIPLADMQQYADALRRQEYEARHPQESGANGLNGANGEQAPTSAGQAPTATAETPQEGNQDPIVGGFTNKSGKHVNFRKRTYEKDGIKITEAYGEHDGREVGTRAFMPMPEGLQPIGLPEGTHIVGLSQLRESGDGRKAATLIVQYADGVIDLADVTLTEGGNAAEDTRTPAQRTYDDMTAKYGEKASHKVDVTLKDRKATLDNKKKALDKAQTEYDDAPIGKEDKAEAALTKAQEEYDNALADYNAWDEVRKLRDQALLAQAEQEEQQRKADNEARMAAERRAQEQREKMAEEERERQRVAQQKAKETEAALAASATVGQRSTSEAVPEGRPAASKLAAAREELADDPEALAMLEDMEPHTLDEVAAMMMATGSSLRLQMEDEEQDGVRMRGFRTATGYSRGDAKQYPFAFATREKGGISFDEFGERVLEVARDEGVMFDERDAMAGANAAIEMLSRVKTQGDINDYILDNRIAAARAYHERMQNEVAGRIREAYGMTEEEYNSYMSWLEDAAEQRQNTLTDEQALELINQAIQQENEQQAETNAGNSEQQGTETAERTESVEAGAGQDGGRGNSETDAAEQAEVSTAQAIAAAEAETDTNPTEGQKVTDKEQATLDKFNTLTERAGEIKAEVGQLIGEPTRENYDKATDEVKAKVDALLGEYRGLFSDLPKNDLLTLKRKVWAMLGSAQEQYRQNESKENGNQLNRWANLDTEINKALRDHYGDKNLYMGDMVVPFKGEQSETWDEHVNKVMEAYDKEYAAIEKSDGERLRKEAAEYSDERLLNTYIRNAGISQIFGKGREGMRKFVSEEKSYNADKLDEAKENHLEAAPNAARQSFVQDVLRAELDRRGIEYKEEYTFAETSEAEAWYKKNIEGKPKESGKGEKVKNEAAPKQKIGDVGEKIGGARKDLAQKMGAKINLDADTFPKMFPKFDLKKAVEQGLDPKLASSVYFLRIAAQKEYKSWLKHSTKEKALSAAKFFAAYAKQFLENGNTSTEFKDSRWTFTEYGKKHIEYNLALYEKVYEKFGNTLFDLDLTGYEILPIEKRSGSHYYRKNEKGESEEYQPAYNARSVYSSKYYVEGELDKAIDELVDRMAESVSYKESHPYKLSHYYTPGVANSHYIGVKLGGKVVPLTDKMGDREASQYLSEHEAELQEKAKRLDEERKQSKQGGTNTKWKPELGLGGGRARVGEDYRNGKDVSADKFRETFGFRGVEFGNYVTQAERQRFLNEAYDAMMDLAALLNVSPRALSLGGRLGFAIGARGGGSAMAHYEPDLNVINLTKSKGAGSLAHEWWHALDYYFNRMGDRRKTPATGNRRAEDFNPGQRREMEDAFESLMEKINGSDYRKRSVALDAALSKDYYTNPTELGARAFQDYVQRRLTDKGQVNDFLSSFTPEEQWNGKAETYPYPTGKDADAIDERFDNLFGTMLEREDEQGNVMLYERVDGKAAKVSAKERKLRDAIVDLLRKAGIDVVTESEEGQRVLDEGNGKGVTLNKGQKRILETAPLIQEEGSRADISSIDGAKVLKNLDILAEKLENSSSDRKNFLQEVGNALNAKQHGSKSQYATFETKNGQIVTIRLGNHNATVSSFDNNWEDNGISIVISRRANEGITNDGKAHLVEYFYSDKAINRAEGKPLAEIVRSIKQALYSGEYNDTTGLAEREEVNAEQVRMHRVYHGSGADFERFDHSHIGEGEGAQAFGWGTYVTEVEGIGRHYAEKLPKVWFRDTRKGFDVDLEEVRDNWDESDVRRVPLIDVFEGLRSHNNNIDEAIEDARKIARHRVKLAEEFEDWRDQKESIEAGLAFLEELSADDFEIDRHLYTVEIPEDNGSNYIEWNEPIKQKQLTKIASALAKEKGKEYGDYLKEKKGSYGENIYYELYTAFGSQQAASELLHSAGFVGVKYPAEYYSGGRSDGAKNYVIFDESDLQITDKVKFFRTENGETYGFTMGGKIYLDPKIATAETPIHEYTHLWAEALRAANPKAWEQLKSELEKDKDLMAYVQRLYPELKGDELMDEVFAHFSGRRGAERLRAEQERMEGETRSLVGKAKVIAMFENLRDALKKFWNAARDLFAGKGVKNESAEDFADMVLGDLVSGFNPSTDSEVRFRGEERERESREEAAQGDWSDRESVERIGEFAGYSPEQVERMSKRQEESARKQFNDAAEKLHLGDRITFVDTIDEIEGIDERTREARRRKKGWFDPRTGKIVIILGNHRSMDDVMKSIMHEGVAHHGLRQLFGEHFNTFLDNVYQAASPEIRGRINEMAKKHGWDFREATEEYLAMLAEDTDFEKPENQSWWKQVKAWFIDLLHKIGFKLHDAYGTITDNELRYILWRSYENLVNPGRYNSVVEEAKDIAKQYELKVGQWDETWTVAAEAEPNATIEFNGRRVPIWATNGRRGNRADRVERNDRMGSDYNVAADGVAEDGVRFRDGEDEETGAPKPQARGAYERMVSSAASQWKEAMQDSMLSLKKLYQAVSQAYKGSTKGVYRIEDEKGYENAYLAENRMHSMSEAQIHAYQQDYMKPLQRAIHALTDGKREAYETLTDYMMAKHGLERNEVMAKRDAKKAWEEQNKSEIGNPNYTATKNAVFANIDAGVDDLYLEYRKQDYAGLTALTGIEDVEEAEKEAQRMVDEYEQQHDTTDLWIATNRATRRSLFKMLESGLLSPERHAEIRDMYQYYIPLQGFDSDVAEDVYAYMGSDGTRLYGTTIRAAKGRKSKADDPIATIAMNGEAAIRRGNRNLMKQHFLRFVQSHPSDLVSINDVWLRKNANGEWEQYFDADLKETDTPEEVARKVRDFNERMEQEAAANPDLYKRSRDLPNVPFRVLNVRDMEQHQVMVQVDGKNYLLTINGNPRAAQALNGLTNPDVFTEGAFGSIMNATQSVVRTLSQFYTTRNPNFVLSNFLRDAVYTNSMVLAKESPNYALNFHKNFLLLPNERMGVLFASWENGKLREKLANGTASNMEKMFYDFMMNGGETGWTSLRDIEKHKRDLQKALKREGNIAASALNKLGDFFDITNRMIENHARFTAYVTSIEMGRSVERAVWDAKEISVNFNKKGAGDKFLKAKNQTFVGKVGAFVSGLGRGNYAFWNASLQGLNNIARIGKRNPAKFMAVATTLMGLGVAIPLLNALLGGDDDDDKNAYWNLPEYVRRSNICFRFTKDMPWITIPLPIEFRAIYGLGELGSGVALGKEYYSKGELTKQVAAQFSQVLPLDFMEGGGGWHCLYPTYIKPVIEAYSNQSWTGLPIYRKNTYGQYDVAPEWQRAYSNTNNQIMAATKWLNEATGGDEVQGGNIDFNPARIEYMLRGYLGGYFTVADQVIKMGETATGNREFEWRNMMLANRVVKEGDERTEARKLTNEYFNLKEEYDKTDKSLKAYKKKQDEGTLSVVGQAHYIALMNDSEEYGRYLVFGTYKPLFDAYYKQIKEANAAGDSEEAKRLERGQNELRREMVNIIHDMDNGGTFDRKKVATGINENLKKMQNDKLWDAQDKAINKSIEADNALNPTDNVEE